MSISSRITSIEEHIGNAYDKIDDLGIDSTGIDKNINNIASLLDTVYEEYPKVPGQGTEVTLDGTKVGKLSLDVKGNSTQNGTPAPDNEVPILSAGDNGSISEKIVNKNLFDKNNFTYVDKKRLDDNGNVVNDNDSSYSTTLIKVQPSTTYTIQGTQSISGKTTRVYYYDENRTFLSRSSSYSTDSYSFTTPSNCYYIALQLRNSTYIDLDIIQIELGSTTTTYTAHQEQTYTISVQQPMRSIGDIRDEFIQVNGEWKERHNILSVIFDGTETDWTIDSASNTNRTIFRSPSIATMNNYPSTSTLPDLLSNYFIRNTQAATWVVGNITRRMYGNNNVYLTVEPNMTVAQFKEWLSTHNTEVLYVPESPTDLPCTEEQIAILENLPKSYDEQTNIYSLDVTPAYIEAKALKGE